MLRVTIKEAPESLTLKLEGSLAGPWVLEAQNCWQRMQASQPGSIVRFDLTGVTMIDPAGKSLLAKAHAEGAQFVASGCLMRAIIADVINSKKSPDDVDKAAPQTTYL